MGFSSAVSKAGAAISTTVFARINDKAGDRATFLIGAGFAVLGGLVAWFVIPDVSARLGDEDEAWRVFLEEQGWRAEWGNGEAEPEKEKV